VEGTLVHSLYTEAGRTAEDIERMERLRRQPGQAFRLGRIAEGAPMVLERHRHRFEVADRYVDTLSECGLVFSGYHERADGTRLMEFIEFPDHPFFVATQAHPEFRSSLERPAPLFHGYIRAALEYQDRRGGTKQG